ncbi:atpase (aaa+ superfamily) [Leptolyngbya sp. Heron Island J]|uniref:AAA-like domain-containing protein n=1 Tax=Leptolyngbya sp. Heron Island J TaxID=1385935 RepID=UPI0003B9E744|nr:AAA-like domain-containing protein [Leptolyngbya sp. Heron Island J]ESA35918.1 atpase (aaa+ superfamily) [Leptolyngbya sp. Heron Island J]
MNLDALIELLSRDLIDSQNRPLNAPEIMILRGIWQYRTYKQIAMEGDYSPIYFTNVVAPELFKRLSKLIGQRITKKTCRALLEAYATGQVVSDNMETSKASTNSTSINRPLANSQAGHQIEAVGSPRYPSGSVPVGSPYYIERTPLEELTYAEIMKPGALVRIKAPQEMGKTSLLLRILDYANHHGYRTVSLNLQQIDDAILGNLNRFLRWLCANVSHQLNLESKLDDYWDEDIGGKVSCTLYFQDYILRQINEPFVLALDEVNKLFEYPQVAKDVLPLFRSWYEEAKRLPCWGKLRLVVIHSTEIYVPLQLKQSPFNVGLPIQLEGFSLEQIQQLAKCYDLDWDQNNQQVQQLMDIVGGHPALVHITLYYLSQRQVSLAQLLEKANTPTGIYNYHLQRHWANLEEQPELLLVLKSVMAASEPVSLEPMIIYRLSSMGLIKQSGNKVLPSCELYRKSFLQGKQHA